MSNFRGIGELVFTLTFACSSKLLLLLLKSLRSIETLKNLRHKKKENRRKIAFLDFFIYLKALCSPLLEGREEVSPEVSLIEPAVGGLDGSVMATISSVSAMLESLSTSELAELHRQTEP